MGYLTSVQETWGPCFYNISQQGSLIPFLKIYGLCVQERRLVTSAVSTPPQPVPPHRDPRRRQELLPSLAATGTLRGGRRLVAVLSRMESAPGRTNHLTPSRFVCTSFAYKSFHQPTNSHQSQQLRERREAQTKAVSGEECALRMEAASLQKLFQPP